MAICRDPGRSQEELATELCVNKSTVARNLNYLQDTGYITRESTPGDKRQFAVYPTKKLQTIIPEIREVSKNWRTLLCEGISQKELEIFDSVLERMEARAREILEEQEDN